MLSLVRCYNIPIVKGECFMKEDNNVNNRTEEINKEWENLGKQYIQWRVDYGKNLSRSFNPTKTDEELGFNKPIYQFQLFSFWKNEINRFSNFIKKLKDKF